MNERIHDVLDGELAEEELSPAERQILDRMLAACTSTADALREATAPDLTQRVLAALPEPSRASPWTSWISELAEWVWRPRAIQLRPAYGLAGIAAIVMLAILARSPEPGGPVATDPAAAEEIEAPVLYVQFRLEAPGARRVQLTGSFTNWEEGVELVETMPGVWSTMLRLEPGVHDYSFIVDDGVWVVDPSAPSIEDPFGGMKSRLFLTSPLENA